MMNRIKGKASVCDRDSIIYHYDNTSRKKLWNDPKKIQDMRTDHNYLFSKIANGEMPVKNRKRKKFSIITLVNDNNQYFDFMTDIQNQSSIDSFEVIALPNYNNEYKSCAQALNVGMDMSESEYCILCHQDIRMDEKCLDSISKHIDELNKDKINWGVLGMAGSYFNAIGDQDGVSYLTNKDSSGKMNYEVAVSQKGSRAAVQTLDELCLITKTNIGIRFDEATFNHYHWYGADFCLSALARGYKNYAINAPCFHVSDGFSNLAKIEHRDKFLEGAASLYAKWRASFPSFRTTTANFTKTVNKEGKESNLIHFYVAENLIKSGVQFPRGISVT